MPKGQTRSLSRAPAHEQPITKKTIQLRAVPIEIDGASGVGWGTAVIGDFPEGNVLFLGAVGNIQIAGPGGDAGLVDTWQGDFGIGTTPADDGTITAGDVDLVPSTALAAATAEVSPRTRGANAQTLGGVILDNTDGSLEINLNALVDDAHISADDIPCTANGELHIAYIMLGDD